MEIKELIKKQFDTDKFEEINNESQLNLYKINESIYMIIKTCDLENLYNDYIESVFEDSIYEVPRHWRDYIDKESWIKDYMYDFGISDFVDEQLNYYYYDIFINFIDDIYGYTIYKIEGEIK